MYKHAAVTAASVVLALPVFAQSLDDEFITSEMPPAIHATRLDYSEFDSPEAVTVITREDIAIAGYLEVSEIFRSVPGFRIVKVGDESRVSYHGTAASQTRRMMVTIDGRSVLIGDGQYVEFDRLPIDFEDIARITVTRGPNGAAYGDNAFLVSIDFQTVGRDDARGTSVRLGGGANDRERYSLSSHESLGNFDFSLTAGLERDGGYDFSDEMRTPREDGKEIKRARLGIDYRTDVSSHWRFDANAYDSEHAVGSQLLGLSGQQTNDGVFFAFSNQREIGRSSRLDWFVSHNRQRESIRHRGCYTPETLDTWRSLAGTDPRIADILAPTTFVPRLLGTTPASTCFFFDIDVEAERTEAEIEFESRRGPWRYVVGIAGGQTDAESPHRWSNVDQRQRSKRVFAETAYALGNVNLSAGGMAQDANNVEHTEYAWRGAVNWQLVANQMVRYSYSHSFRIPSLVETSTLWSETFFFGRAGESESTYQFSLPGPSITSSASIGPETIDQHAIGFYGTFLNNQLSVDTKIFEEEIHNPILLGAFYFDPPARHGDSYDLTGLETEVSYTIDDRWKLGGQYSYLDNNSKAAFERSLHSDHGSSAYIAFRPLPAHTLRLGYYGNSAISNNSYDRYDVVYTFNRNFGANGFRFQFVYQRHVGGIDGIRETDPTRILLQELSIYEDLDQVFAFAEFAF